MAIQPEAGRSCSTWDVPDHADKPITIGFAARVLAEFDEAGRTRLICRAVNWRSICDESTFTADDLGQRIFDGAGQPGIHRALVDLKTWKLLKWLDDPCPFYDWRAREDGESIVHPDDQVEMNTMARDFDSGSISRVVRLRAVDGGWAPIHVTAHRVEIGDGAFVGLLSLRIPMADELVPPPCKATRRTRARADRAARTR